jgi:hypothetical protein
VVFDMTNQPLIRFLHSSNTGKKWKCTETVHKLLIDFKKTYDLVRRVVLYNILMELGYP